MGAARDRWLAEFPDLAASEFGRVLAENSTLSAEDPAVARLADFYSSELYGTLAPLFASRVEAMRAGWRGA